MVWFCRVTLFLLVCSSLLTQGLLFSACDDDDSTSSGQADDDSPDDDDMLNDDNDDTSPDDDDNNDDDASPNDDDDNNDATDDDDDNNNDNDDDDDNNDNNDNDDNDDDHEYPPDEGEWFGEVFIQKVAGESPGEPGTATVIGPDGAVHVAAQSGGSLYVYTRPGGGGAWRRELVDRFAWYPAMAIDESGFLHLSYQSINGYNLMYATNRGGAWQARTLDDAGDVGEYNAIALDAAGKAYIAYYDANSGTGGLRLATNKNGAWETMMLYAGTEYGRAKMDLAVGPTGMLHLLFCDYVFPGCIPLYMAYDWNEPEVWTIRGSGAFGDIKVDSRNNVHLCQGDTSLLGALYYTSRIDGEWQETLLDGIDTCGYYCQVALDAGGNVHIGFQYDSPKCVGYATNRSGAWEVEQLSAETTSDASYLSMALGPHAKPHIAYVDDNYNLVYTTKKYGEWKNKIIQEDLDDWREELFIDETGEPVIFYQERPPGASYEKLRRSVRSAGVWRSELVYNQIDSANAAIDSDGVAHVIFTVANGEVWYGNDAGGVWTFETVLTDAFVDCLEVNNLNDPAFLFDQDSVLYYVFLNESGWQSEVVDNYDVTLKSLAFDSEGFPYIFYRVRVFAKSQNQYRLAIRIEDQWNIEEVTPWGEYTSEDMYFTIDSLDRPQYLICGDDEFAIYYGVKDDGEWLVEVLEPDPEITDQIKHFFLLDAEDRAHLVNPSHYMHNMDGVWRETTLPPDLDLSYVNYAALDQNGLIHQVLELYGGLYYMTFPRGYALNPGE